MSTLACPSCGAVLAKLPQRKTKCKSCGEFIFVRSSPDNQEKRLMTAAQAEKAERAWAKSQELKMAREAELAYRESLLRIEIDLRKAQAQGFASVQIFGADERTCPVCVKLNRTVIPVGAAATDVLDSECERLNAGKYHCGLMISPAIKRPDGGVYFDKTEGRGP